MYKVNSLKPDFILNTGDFIDFGWREFEKDDTSSLKQEVDMATMLF